MRISKRNKILELTDGGRMVFAFYIGPEMRLNRKMLNPLYNDTNPSCYIYRNKKSKKCFLHDYGDNRWDGDCFTFVQHKFNLAYFNQSMDKIIDDLGLPIPKLYTQKRFMQPEQPKKKRVYAKKAYRPFSYQVQSRDQANLPYWNQYGINMETLVRYNVLALTSFTTIGKKGSYTLTATHNSPIFAYKGKDFVKIYRPFEENRFQYGGQKPANYIFGMKQLPQYGDFVFITGGEKDVLSLAAHGFHAISLNSETCPIPVETIEILSNRFRHIIVMYDADETGVQWMQRAEEEHEDYDVLTLELPLPGVKTAKDISDFFALGHTAQELRDLVSKELETLYAESRSILDACEVLEETPPMPSGVIVSSHEAPIGTADNIMCVSGTEGAGKSHFVSALLAGALLEKASPESIDTLGFQVAPNKDKKAVLWFDTEQSEYQLYKNKIKTRQRSGLDKCPPFFHSLSIMPLSLKSRLQIIKDGIAVYHKDHGGIHLVVIDGIADLVETANNEQESIVIMKELFRLAAMYHTCIICVLHNVPGGQKLRGHLGSEATRKAAGIVSVDKDEEDKSRSLVRTLKVRDGDPLSVPVQICSWDAEKDMFVSVGQQSIDQANKSRLETLQKMAETLLKETPLTYSQMIPKIKEYMAVQDRTAKQYMKVLYENNIIESYNKKYQLKRPVTL